jgi:hypothetical protein
MKSFGVHVQIYDKDFTGNLLKIDKQGNRIEFGSEIYSSEGNKILYETETVLQGYTEVSNYTGFKITNKIENSYTVIVPHEKDVSFMDYFGQPNIYKDIVISRGLRFNDQTDNLVIQKSGEDDDGTGKILIPYGTDLTNIGSRLTTLESECLTIEKIDVANLFVGISKIHEVQNISFMNDWGSSSTSNDIVISKGLRFNHQTDNLVIQKPGENDVEPVK